MAGFKNSSSETMMMRRYDLTGSMKQSLSPFLMDDKDFTYLKNVSYDEIGSLSKDGGYTQFGVNLDTTGTGDLLHSYLDEFGVIPNWQLLTENFINILVLRQV